MPPKPAGATEQDILNEPDWTATHSHRVGLRNRDDRFTGLTHLGDDWRFELEKEAEEKAEELREKVARGELLTVRDFLSKQEDFHIRRPEVHPKHARYVLHTTEGFIKDEQSWLINAKKKKREDQQTPNSTESSEKRHRKDEKECDSHDKYTPEQRRLLQNLKEEAEYMRSLKSNDGKGRSPIDSAFISAEIDEIDQFTPDNWVPRTDHLIRLTGKHPLNGEADLVELLEAGLITPNWLHYVRNHGAVPHLLWENHKLEVSAGKSLTLFTDDLADQFCSINIPVLLACDGNRRKELNMIKRSKGFNFGPGAVSCACWKGVLLRDVLLKADVSQLIEEYQNARLWVNFQGAEYLTEGKYETSVPLEYVMDPFNDVMLAYEMNDSPLPHDHGYPLRLIVPGYVGGRSVKWLEKIWVTDHENNSYYHVFDNRVVPGFVVDRFDEMGQTMYRHPSTACMEQVLNSVIVKPAQGEKIHVADMRKDKTYRIKGYAYNGGGNEMQKVEVSLDGGDNWLYCIRQWHIEVDVTELLQAESIIVRCWDVNMNTQPLKPTWNLEGMMNNCQYIVKPEITEDADNRQLCLFFRHPVEPANGENGWMNPSVENTIEYTKRQAAAPDKQFTREEIEKHHTDQDCWIVINDKVYDATSVLSWHPGGREVVMSHGGRVHKDTTEEFESIHDDYAHGKLQECLLGIVTKKAQEFMKKEAEERAKERINSVQADGEMALKRHQWTQARLIDKKRLSADTNRYTFALPPKNTKLGLEIGQHIQIGFHFKDRLVVRPYTPVRPLFQSEEDGTFDLVVKTYYPDNFQPGGTMSNILDCLRNGEEIEMKGPSGDIRYCADGQLVVNEETRRFDRITLILGGSGITPGYQLIARILLSEKKGKKKIRVIDANKTENDILLRTELDRFAREHPDQFEITYVLSNPGPDWEGEKGHMDKRILHQYSFEPGERNVALLCGPPAMIQRSVLPVLLEWGYDEDRNLFGF